MSDIVHKQYIPHGVITLEHYEGASYEIAYYIDGQETYRSGELYNRSKGINEVNRLQKQACDNHDRATAQRSQLKLIA